MISILDHPDWERRIRPVLRIQIYGRDGDGRIRLEAAPSSPAERVFLLSLVTTCPKCGASVNPFRERKTDGWGMYYAASCRLEERYECSRSQEASDEYERVANAVLGHLSARQLSFFDGEARP